MKNISILILILALVSCSQEEITRIDLTKDVVQVVNVKCEKHRQIDFYLDCDIEFTEYPNMVLDFEFYQGKQQLLKGGLDPLNCSNLKNESKVVTNDTTRWKFYGKLEGNFIPPADTIFSIYPTLVKNNTKNFKIYKMDLVFVR